MLLREVEYARPATVEEAISVLATYDGARPLAGGQTLVNVMKARAAAPDVLVDLADLDELRTIGFSVRRDARDRRDGDVRAAAWARPRSRSRGRSSPRSPRRSATSRCAIAARSAGTSASATRRTTCRVLLVALDATFTIRGQDGERTVPADEFFLGVYMTAVGEGELLTKVNVPPSSGAGDGFAGLTIGAHGTYIVNAAASVSGDAARVAIGCVAAAPVRATAMEERLAGGDFSEDAVRAAAEGLGASLDPPSDVHGSGDYRRHLAEVSAVRAVLQAAGRRK